LEVGAGRRHQGRGGGGGGYPGGGGRGRGRGGGGRGRGGGTDLYDAVFLGADEIMKKQHGRKALIVLSDGVDTGSKLSLFSAIESAQRADTLVYSILFEDPDAYGGFGGFGRGRMDEPDGKKVLRQMSTETGGHFFEVSKRIPLDKVYEALEEELRSQYSIGYTPDSKNNSSEFRRIHLGTRQKTLIVQTREGYYPTEGWSGGAWLEIARRVDSRSCLARSSRRRASGYVPVGLYVAVSKLNPWRPIAGDPLGAVVRTA
jgi:hypothetical protein